MKNYSDVPFWPCVDPETFFRGGPTFFFLFFLANESIHMAFHWRADDGPTLNAGFVDRSSIAKGPYIFVIFQGGGGGPDPLDPHMLAKCEYGLAQ